MKWLLVAFLLVSPFLFADEISFNKTSGTPTITANSLDDGDICVSCGFTWTGLHTFNGTFSVGDGLAIASIPAGSASINFTAQTAACEDSAEVAVTGAADGDRCEIGVPAALWGAGDTYQCFVSSAGNVKARHCNVGTGGDPGGATTIKFTVIHY